VHDAGVDRRRAGLGVNDVDAVEVLGEVDDDAGPDGVAGDGGTCASCGDRHTGRRAGVDDGQDLVDVPRPHDDLRHHAVQRGVRAVESASQTGVVDVVDSASPKLGNDVGRHGASMSP
jgi:hypothetical protein